MHHSNITNINKLNIINTTSKQLALSEHPHWLDIVNVESSHDIFDRYAQVCQQFSHEKKWILLVDPTDDSIEMLTNEHNIDVSKILRVSTKKFSMNFSSIENALRKGNCSAVIFNDTAFKRSQISKLRTWAQCGKTQCIVLKTSTRLH